MAGNGDSVTQSRARHEIEAGLRQIIRGLRRLGKEVLKQAAAADPPVRHKVSPGRRLHGQYIGLIRHLSARNKAKVRAVHARKGVEAAIKTAQELRRSK